MSRDSTNAAPDTDAPRKRQAWVLPAIAAVVGLAVGFAVGSGGDPTRSEEYRALSEQLTEAEAELDAAEGEVQAAAARAREAAVGVADREIEVFDREAELDAREAAVTATEEQIAAATITQGTWTVGVDIEPGTYRTKEPVAGDCYWAIYTSGTNKSDIIDNDIVTGGYPTVNLTEGQDFETNRCGEWVK